ncbi:MAG: M50 family metallopeptidase [Candidatus Paracaedibacteraceae bacterium]|nr:M50 family metallopeptidase [Candidatus Paracaedibacteraceae bacterium]
MSWVISNIVPFILVLSILVFVHEYGHFWVGRRNGVRVSTFSIGFGPELFGWTDAQQTRWRVSLIPLGGYVKFFGDQDVSSTTIDKSLTSTLSDDEKNTMLHNKTPLQRIAVAVAGPAANYLFAILILIALIAIKGMPVQIATIGHVEPGSLAERIGIKVNDKIVQLGSHEIKRFIDIRTAIHDLAGKEININVDRNNTPVVLQAKLYTEENGIHTPVKVLGIAPGKPIYEKASPITALMQSTKYCYEVSIGMLQGLWQMATGQAKGEVGGLITIGDMAKRSMEGGIATLALFMAMLSINLGLINLLPVPVLDGGHILLCSIEAIRGRALSEKLQERIFIVGGILVLSLMIYSTGADLMRYKVFSFLGNLIGIK